MYSDLEILYLYLSDIGPAYCLIFDLFYGFVKSFEDNKGISE